MLSHRTEHETPAPPIPVCTVSDCVVCSELARRTCACCGGALTHQELRPGRADLDHVVACSACGYNVVAGGLSGRALTSMSITVATDGGWEVGHVDQRALAALRGEEWGELEACAFVGCTWPAEARVRIKAPANEVAQRLADQPAESMIETESGNMRTITHRVFVIDRDGHLDLQVPLCGSHRRYEYPIATHEGLAWSVLRDRPR